MKRSGKKKAPDLISNSVLLSLHEEGVNRGSRSRADKRRDNKKRNCANDEEASVCSARGQNKGEKD